MAQKRAPERSGAVFVFRVSLFVIARFMRAIHAVTG
jgi:hypothetical protein